MTGAEIAGVVAAGKAASSAGKVVLGESAAAKQQLAELAKASPAMRAAAKDYAKRIAIKQAVLLKLYRPLAKWAGLGQAYFESDFQREMAEKVADIPDERLVTPPASIAVPAMQGLSYSIDEPDLKEMYLNLLATATDGRRASDAHPSFAEIIKNLSAEEARLLTTCLPSSQLPIVEIRRKVDGENGYRVLATHVMNLTNAATNRPVVDEGLPVFVDNWIRLGLVEVTYGVHITDDAAYEWADDRPELAQHRSGQAGDGVKVESQKGVLRITNFGARFARAIGSGQPVPLTAPSTPTQGAPDDAPPQAAS